MLQELIAFLQACSTKGTTDNAVTAPALDTDIQQHSQIRSRAAAGDESKQSQPAMCPEAADAVVSAALEVTSVLLAHDQACQQAILEGLDQGTAKIQVTGRI